MNNNDDLISIGHNKCVYSYMHTIHSISGNGNGGDGVDTILNKNQNYRFRHYIRVELFNTINLY